MSDHTTVHVSGISPSTTEKEVQDFFSFWYAPTFAAALISFLTNFYSGKIVSISVTPTSSEPDASKSATVTFEKDA
jgi:hypothetical protein